jgi:hypothetical protein
MNAVVHAADIQDRDGGPLVIETKHGLFPFITNLFGEGGYQGPQFRKALAKVMPQLSVEIVKRSDTAKGFQVLPRRWATLPFHARERVEWQWRALNGPWLGSTFAADWRRISRTLIVPPSHSSSLRRSG